MVNAIMNYRISLTICASAALYFHTDAYEISCTRVSIVNPTREASLNNHRARGKGNEFTTRARASDVSRANSLQVGPAYTIWYWL